MPHDRVSARTPKQADHRESEEDSQTDGLPGRINICSRASRWCAYIVAVGVLSLAACSGPSPANSTPSAGRAQSEILMVDDQPRDYLLFRPATANGRVPLVIALHGYGNGHDARSLENRSQYDALATQEKFVVTYPEGVNISWNAGICCGGSDSDVTFIKDLITKLVGDGTVDSKRVFAVGVSNGAMMAQRLGCELAGQITAIASVSGTIGIDSCSPSRAVSILEMHGMSDTTIPYEGGSGSGLPIMTVMQGWATRDDCPASAVETDRGITKTYTWAPCRGGGAVVLDAIVGGGHNWFGPDMLPDKLPGEPSATLVTWSFFEHAPPLS
jgi:polyhydroxybutyrate depolymerase